MEAEGGAVGAQMAVNVVTEHAAELFAGSDVGARIDHVATGKRFVEGGVITTIELVDNHFPDGVAAAGTVLGVADALVGHAEVQSVGPDGNTAERCSDGRIVNKELVSHHVELLVAADTQVRSSHTDDGAVGDVGETLDDQSVAGHLSQPIIVATFGPVLGTVLASNGERGDLVTATVKVLHGRVVGVFVGDEEGSCTTQWNATFEKCGLRTCFSFFNGLPLAWQPLGLRRRPLKISSYKSMLSVFMAPLKVSVIICGTLIASNSPGMRVPSAEQ